jgi:hypothetical protein
LVAFASNELESFFARFRFRLIIISMSFIFILLRQSIHENITIMIGDLVMKFDLAECRFPGRIEDESLEFFWKLVPEFLRCSG